MEEFMDQIVSNLSQNGFPQKKVALPTEKMYEIADKKGLSLNSVLERLATEKQIAADIQTERIIFSLSNSGEDMFAQAQEMMGQMDPAELEHIKSMIDEMGPEEKAQMMEQAQKMFKGK